MDEYLFIDEVDTEWCLRARARGYQCIGACGAVMAHTLGSDTMRLHVGRSRHVPIHSPVRLYYIMRNGLLLARMPHVPATWWLTNLKRLAAQFVLFSVLVAPRWRNLRMMSRGILDGLLGRGGPHGAGR
jgi:rhamnosyltransferase